MSFVSLSWCFMFWTINCWFLDCLVSLYLDGTGRKELLLYYRFGSETVLIQYDHSEFFDHSIGHFHFRVGDKGVLCAFVLRFTFLWIFFRTTSSLEERYPVFLCWQTRGKGKGKLFTCMSDANGAALVPTWHPLALFQFHHMPPPRLGHTTPCFHCTEPHLGHISEILYYLTLHLSFLLLFPSRFILTYVITWSYKITMDITKSEQLKSSQIFCNDDTRNQYPTLFKGSLGSSINMEQVFVMNLLHV